MLLDQKTEKATFAGGCFWCMVAPFEKLPGVISVVAGYAGGKEENPTYQDYAKKGYVEAIEVEYDAQKINYSALLDTFWRQIDPTDSGGQFADRGPHYRTVIFYRTPEQKKEAELSKNQLAASHTFENKIATEIIPFTNFYLAEQYHQQFYKKNPERYKMYAQNSGREQFLKNVWNEKQDELQKKLTPLQFDVIKCGGTEPAFNNEYWNNKEPGIYVDRISGEPLFSSLDKYDSGTGWPSFSKPLESDNVRERDDNSLSLPRREVVSAKGESHLGHVFPDGPQPTGLRYCMNSAALRFIPVKDLEKEGYGMYLSLFR